tara:strand:- start:157 stop:363 length:207 start_codon:yes stop_codon:yes gene_type:complete
MAKQDMEIYADDGRLSFYVEDVNREYITLKTKCDGFLHECKGIDIPESSFDDKELNDKDKLFLDFAVP